MAIASSFGQADRHTFAAIRSAAPRPPSPRASSPATRSAAASSSGLTPTGSAGTGTAPVAPSRPARADGYCVRVGLLGMAGDLRAEPVGDGRGEVGDLGRVDAPGPRAGDRVVLDDAAR